MSQERICPDALEYPNLEAANDAILPLLPASVREEHGDPVRNFSDRQIDAHVQRHYLPRHPFAALR